jgi:hypothetical protein
MGRVLEDAGVRVRALTLPGLEWTALGEPGLAELAAMRDVEYVDLPTGHWPQFTRPRELGQAILAAVNQAGP